MRIFGRREGGAAVAAYAGVLDGVHLWLSLESGEAAQLEGQGRILPLDGVTDLLTLIPGGMSDPPYWDIVSNERGVWAAADAVHGPRISLSPDGLTRLILERTETGHLRVSRHAAPPTAQLEAIDVRSDRVHLRIQPHDGVEPGCHLLLLDADDQVLATLPVTAHDGHVEALVGVDDLPAGYFGMLRPAVGTDAAWVRIRRRANALADPNHAVLLPELYAVPDQPRARFRWNPDGLLALRSIDPDGAQE